MTTSRTSESELPGAQLLMTVCHLLSSCCLSFLVLSARELARLSLPPRKQTQKRTHTSVPDFAKRACKGVVTRRDESSSRICSVRSAVRSMISNTLGNQKPKEN
eukprot:3941192-Rhodomonas_salina.2